MPASDHASLQALLRRLLQQPRESGWLEFTRSNSSPEEIGQYVSALANSAALAGMEYAYLVWGVDDATHEVVGTTFRVQSARKGNEELEGWLRRLVEPDHSLQLHEVDLDGKLISLMQVPRASHRPVSFQGREFIRVGSYTKPLREHPDIERQLWRLFDTRPFESLVALGGLTAAQVLGLLNYPAFFRLLGVPLPAGPEQILERLAGDRFVRMSSDGYWGVTNLGAVLLAHQVTAFPRLGRKSVRVVVYRDSSRIETTREIERQAGYAADFEELMSALSTLLPSNEVLGQALRRQVPMYPEVAVRELVANALIHQDLTVTGAGPMVEIFADRMEISNPGTPLVELDRFIDTCPRSRNEDLASFMRRAGICEERGSGIDKVVSAIEAYQLPAPLFEAPGDNTRVVLYAHRPLSGMSPSDRVRACYQHTCLRYVSSHETTNGSLRQRFQIEERNRAQVSRILRDTVEKGLIRPRDPDSSSRRMASYVPYWA
ncbi:MAG TPA: ATP-binding protein [Armatimonadota bacterium]|jgi:predicted HTH transcriptional regulator